MLTLDHVAQNTILDSCAISLNLPSLRMPTKYQCCGVARLLLWLPTDCSLVACAPWLGKLNVARMSSLPIKNHTSPILVLSVSSGISSATTLGHLQMLQRTNRVRRRQTNLLLCQTTLYLPQTWLLPCSLVCWAGSLRHDPRQSGLDRYFELNMYLANGDPD